MSEKALLLVLVTSNSISEYTTKITKLDTPHARQIRTWSKWSLIHVTTNSYEMHPRFSDQATPS